MSKTSAASVVTAPGVLSLRDFELPTIADDDGLLRVESCGVCGTDVRDLPRALPPRIMGHEIVGVVESLGDRASTKWGVSEGDRILLEEYVPCGVCGICRSGDYRLCFQTDILTNPRPFRYGATSLAEAPALWGGYSQYVYLHSNAVVHPVPPGIESAAVPLAVPLSNGYEWMCLAGGIKPAECVVIIGPGQQGLACLFAAKLAGAAPVIVAGLRKDARRLAVAAEMGADLVVNTDETPLYDAVRDVTRGEMADMAIDAAAANERTLGDAVASLRKNGRLVIGARNDEQVSFPVGALRGKTLTIKGVRGHSCEAVAWALKVLPKHLPLAEKMSSGSFGLSDVDKALGVTSDGSAIHVRVDPWA